ncbi:hypothetical protein OY671_012316, partial [Metschnikowia pulcherrima]
DALPIWAGRSSVVAAISVGSGEGIESSQSWSGTAGDSSSRCTCGHDSTQECTEAVTSDDTIGDAYLIGRLGDGPRISHAFLDSSTFADAAEIMQWVGSVARWGRSIVSWRRQEPAERTRTMAAGFAVCADLPHQFANM